MLRFPDYIVLFAENEETGFKKVLEAMGKLMGEELVSEINKTKQRHEKH